MFELCLSVELNGLNGALFCSWLQLVLCVVCFEFLLVAFWITN